MLCESKAMSTIPFPYLSYSRVSSFVRKLSNGHKCNSFECNVGGEYTHGLRFWGTVFFWKVWRWPWSSCWGRRRCLRCSRRTSSPTAWSACVCLSLRCTMFWLCNSSAGRRQDLCIHGKNNGMLMVLFWLCVLGWVALVLFILAAHLCVCVWVCALPSPLSLAAASPGHCCRCRWRRRAETPALNSRLAPSAPSSSSIHSPSDTHKGEDRKT